MLERPFKPLFPSPVGLFAFEGKVTLGCVFHTAVEKLSNCATSERSNWGLSLNVSSVNEDGGGEPTHFPFFAKMNMSFLFDSPDLFFFYILY